MGRELQKKKNRSSIPKKRQKGPSKKKILQNPIIAQHWYDASLLLPLCWTLTGNVGIKKKHYRKTTAALVSRRASTMPLEAQKRRLRCLASMTKSRRARIPPPAAQQMP